jgi:mRNA-degrading endonuclease toxin of MazEF toxin-antitoxin module
VTQDEIDSAREAVAPGFGLVTQADRAVPLQGGPCPRTIGQERHTRRNDASSQLRRTNGSRAAATELPRDSVVNVAALVTLDKDDLDGLIGRVSDYLMQHVDRGLRQVLGV